MKFESLRIRNYRTIGQEQSVDLIKWPHVRAAEILDFTGVSGMEGFMKATYEYIYKERPVVTVIDGDEAGTKTRKALQHYFGKKNIPFASKLDFITLHDGFALEGLFPHKWIVEAQLEHAGWFSDFDVDVAGVLKPFTVKDNHKEQLRAYLKAQVAQSDSLDWCIRFNTVFDVLEAALLKRYEAIYGVAFNKDD